MKLKDKVVIITGSTSGIGKASALLFAKEGAKVVISGRNMERGNQVVEEIKAFDGEAIFVKTDVKNHDDIDNLIKSTLDAFDKTDICFYNSGISISPPDFFEFTDEIYNDIMDTNIGAAFYMTREVLPYILETKGNILYTGSIASIRLSTLSYVYAASKFAIIGMMKALAVDYSSKGVRFNALCPGLTKTSILESVPEDTLSALSSSVPMGRLGNSEEMAKAALYLVSDDASYITGQTLVVDGGYVL